MPRRSSCSRSSSRAMPTSTRRSKRCGARRKRRGGGTSRAPHQRGDRARRVRALAPGGHRRSPGSAGARSRQRDAAHGDQASPQRASRRPACAPALSAVLRSRLTVAAVTLAIVAFVGVKVIPPMLSRWQAAVAAQAGSSQPAVAAVHDGGGFRQRTRPDAVPAAPAPSPAETGRPRRRCRRQSTRTPKLKNAVEQARTSRRARAGERGTAKASGLPRFRPADDGDGARVRSWPAKSDYEDSARAYNNATQLFRRSIDDVESALAKAEPPPGGATIGNKPAVTPSNPSSRESGERVHS